MVTQRERAHMHLLEIKEMIKEKHVTKGQIMQYFWLVFFYIKCDYLFKKPYYFSYSKWSLEVMRLSSNIIFAFSDQREKN